MGYVLEMSIETHDWLTELRDSDPPAARRVGEALTALMGEGPSLGPPLVIPAADVTRQPDLAEALDWSYQLGLARRQAGRRRVAAAATTAERLRRQIAELESLQARLDDQHRRALDAGQQALAGQVAEEQAAAQEQLAGLRKRLDEVSQIERKLTEESRRQMRQADAFSTRKEVLKARYLAAQAEAAMPAAFAAGAAHGAGDLNTAHQASADQVSGGRDTGSTDTGSTDTGSTDTGSTDTGSTDTGSTDTGSTNTGSSDQEAGEPGAAAARLREVEEEIERELARAPWAEGAGDLRPQTGLMQLRPGAPGDDDLRILFAVEPPGTALLLAVLEGREALRDHYDEAVSLSREVLRLVRDGQRSEETRYGFADEQSFLDEFFAGAASDVEAGAAALAAANRARTLAELRDRLGLTRAEVAERMGVRPERVAAIERAGPGATEVRALAGYVEALGGRLEVVADVGGEHVLLR
jgi:phage shock protein A